MKQIIAVMLPLLASFTFTMCHDDSGDNPANTDSFNINITGLLGNITVRNNSESQKTFTGDGTFSLSTSLKEGENYSISIMEEPPHQDCLITNASGMFSETGTDVSISCASKATITPVINNKQIFLNPSSSSYTFLDGETDTADYTLQILQNLLAGRLTEMGAEILCTAGTVSSTETVNAANTWNADIFLYLATNAAGGSGSGTESYYYTSYSEAQRQLAVSIQSQIINVIHSIDDDWPDRGVKTNDTWNIFTSTAMPSTAVFIGFYDSTHDSPIMLGDDFQDMVTYGIIRGIYEYFGASVHPPLPPRSVSLALQAGTRNAVLSWDNNIDDTSGDTDNIYYFIYTSTDGTNYSTQPISTSQTSYTFSDLPAGTYYYKLKTYHTTAGASYSTESILITVP